MFVSFRPCAGPRRGLLFASLALALPALAAPLAFDDSLRLAEQRSRQLPAQEAAAEAARQMAVAAAERPDPVLKAGIGNLPVNGEDRFSLTRDFMTMRSLGVMQELTRGQKLKARAARFDREAESARIGRQMALAALQRDTATAWLERHFLERMRELLLRQRDEAGLQVQAAEAAYRGARGAQAEVFAARSAVAQIEDRIAETERELATAETMLARWVGPAAAGPLGEPPGMERIGWNTDELDSQAAHHPQITQLAQQEAVAQAEAELARANREADPSVELMYSQRGPGYSNMVSITLSIPLQWDRVHRQDRELAARLAAVQQLQAEREEATRAHAAEVRTMLQRWRSARERVTRYDTQLLPLAAERAQAAQAAYRGGTGALASVLEARRMEIDTHMERLRLQLEAARLWAQLNYLVPAARGTTETTR